MDAYLDVRELPDRPGDDGLELRRQGAAVGVAEDERRGTRLRRRPQDRESVVRVVPEAVEKVLGVKEDLFARGDQVRDRVPDGRYVLLGRGPQDLLDVHLPALGDDAREIGRAH